MKIGLWRAIIDMLCFLAVAKIDAHGAGRQMSETLREEMMGGLLPGLSGAIASGAYFLALAVIYILVPRYQKLNPLRLDNIAKGCF